MSASERLRVLDDVRRKDRENMIYNEPLAAAIKTYEALPQIVALVAQYERDVQFLAAAVHEPPCEHGCCRPHFLLAALVEALS